MVGDRGNGAKKYIYRINETTPYQTITESITWNLAMTDLYFICASSSAYKLYYRNTSDVWTEFHSKTTTVVGEYDSDMYDKTAVMQTSTGLDIITIVPGATQDDAPTVTTETITTVNGGCYGCRIYENTIVYADNATKILHVRERLDSTSPWVEVKTYANTTASYGVSLYKNTLTRKDNPQTTALHVHERVNGTWNDTPSSTLILPGSSYGVTTSMFEDYIIMGNPGPGDAALYKRVNGVWQTTHTAVDYGSLEPWDVNIRNNIILIGRGTSVYKYEGTTTILPPELNPFVTISEVANIAENDLTLVSGSVFSSITSITKYYVVAFVTSAPSGSVVDTATIDETTIATFVISLGVLAGTGYKTLFGATGNNIYYNEDGVAQYEVENIANVTVASAFRTLTPTATDGSEMVDITTTSGYSFSTCVIAVDSVGNYGLYIHSFIYSYREALITTNGNFAASQLKNINANTPTSILSEKYFIRTGGNSLYFYNRGVSDSTLLKTITFGLTDFYISYSAQDLMLIDIDNSKLYIFSQQYLVENVVENTWSNLIIPSEHLMAVNLTFNKTKILSKVNFVNGNTRVIHSFQTWITYSFAICVDSEPGTHYRISVYVKKNNNWSFLQHIITDIPQTSNFIMRNLCIKTDTIYLVTSTTTVDIYRFIEGEFTKIQTLTFVHKGSYVFSENYFGTHDNERVSAAYTNMYKRDTNTGLYVLHLDNVRITNGMEHGHCVIYGDYLYAQTADNGASNPRGGSFGKINNDGTFTSYFDKNTSYINTYGPVDFYKDSLTGIGYNGESYEFSINNFILNDDLYIL
jgi:hypothetical protein